MCLEYWGPGGSRAVMEALLCRDRQAVTPSGLPISSDPGLRGASPEVSPLPVPTSSTHHPT